VEIDIIFAALGRHVHFSISNVLGHITVPWYGIVSQFKHTLFNIDVSNKPITIKFSIVNVYLTSTVLASLNVIIIVPSYAIWIASNRFTNVLHIAIILLR